jgi:DNA replication protein DnaC
MLFNPFHPDRIRLLQREEVPDEPEPSLEEHERRETARLADHLRACGAPERAVDVITSGACETVATRAIADWLKTDTPFLLLLGGTGTGKTVAAVGALRSARRDTYFLSKSGPVPCWVYSASAGFFCDIDELKGASYRSEGEELHAKCKRIPLLILDDLGIETVDSKGIWQAAFDALVKARDAKRLRTIITANMTGEQFRATYGDRAYSRIKGAGVVVGCGAQDLRQQKPTLAEEVKP